MGKQHDNTQEEKKSKTQEKELNPSDSRKQVDEVSLLEKYPVSPIAESSVVPPPVVGNPLHIGAKVFNTEVSALVEKGQQTDFKKWISEIKRVSSSKPWEGIEKKEDIAGLYQDFQKTHPKPATETPVSEMPTLRVQETQRLQTKPVSLTYMSLYAGNQENSMKSECKRKNLLVDDILEENTEVLSSYINQIKANSVTPNAKKIEIITSKRKLPFTANPKRLIIALKAIVNKNNEEVISIEPVPVSYNETIRELHRLASLVDPKKSEMGVEEREKTLAMDEKGVYDDRNSQELDELYKQDSITIFIAMKLAGRTVDSIKLMMINRIIQTSGTNQELKPDTAKEAGSLRKGPIALVDGIRLEHHDNIPATLYDYESDYNKFLSKIKNVKKDIGRLHYFYTNAVRLHQRFIQIHPFTNGNGRVARVLFYNLLIAAGLPLFRINPKSETFKAMSGMQLKGQKSIKEMTNYIMGLHAESIKKQPEL